MGVLCQCQNTIDDANIKNGVSLANFKNNNMKHSAQLFKQPNVLFYTECISEISNKYKIKDYHQKRKEYSFLERNHAYIQWLFPNHYRSQFNSDAFPLKEQEAQDFRKQQKIAKNLILSYELITNFMGFKLLCVRTGKLELISQERLRDAIIINTHNHLRIMRIIACLSTVGFRQYAFQLIKSLKQVVQKPKFSSVRRTYQAKWQIYINDDKAKEMCFVKQKAILNIKNIIFDNEQELTKMQNQIQEIQRL